VKQTQDGPLEHYDRLGYVVTGAMVVTILFMHKINRMVGATLKAAARSPAPAGAAPSSASPQNAAPQEDRDGAPRGEVPSDA
jgi:hypothetical protein